MVTIIGHQDIGEIPLKQLEFTTTSYFYIVLFCIPVPQMPCMYWEEWRLQSHGMYLENKGALIALMRYLCVELPPLIIIIVYLHVQARLKAAKILFWT